MIFLLKKYFAFAIVFILFSGCSVWNNFTAYFNRYYNAKQKFDEAVESMKLESKRNLFDFKEDQISAKNKAALDVVIDKCSKLMQFNRDSGFYDDAIFMIGKSYYYQGVYIKALRKFKELQTITDSDLHLENELWIAKTLYQNRQFDEANKILDNTIEGAINEDETEILTEAYLTKIRYQLYTDQKEEAIVSANTLLNYSESSELNANVLYELGKLYLSMEDYQNASKSFEKVDEFSPTFDIQFLSKLEYAKVTRKLGEYENSLKYLNDLYDEDKNKDKRDQIDLEIGEVYYAQNDLQKALKKFSDMDSLYKNSASTGTAIFRRAEILEKDLVMLDSSNTLYAKVAQSSAPAELKNIAKEKTSILNKVKSLKESIANSERQLSYTRDSNNYKLDVDLYKKYLGKRDSLKQYFKEMRQLEGNNFDSTKYAKIKMPFPAEPVFPKIPGDSLKSNIIKAKYELANLFFGELNIPDSSRSQYEDILLDYPGSKLEAKTLFALGSYFLTKNRKDIADSLFREVYNNYKFNPIADAAAERLGLEKTSKKNDPAENDYLETEKLIDQKKFKPAVKNLKSIYQKNNSSPYAAKALYTLGFLYENELNKKDSAAAVYDTLSRKYPKTEFANAVKSKLNFYNSRQKAIADSIAKAKNPIEEKKADKSNLQSKSDIKVKENKKVDSKQQQVISDTTKTNATKLPLEKSEMNKGNLQDTSQPQKSSPPLQDKKTH